MSEMVCQANQLQIARQYWKKTFAIFIQTHCSAVKLFHKNADYYKNLALTV